MIFEIVGVFVLTCLGIALATLLVNLFCHGGADFEETLGMGFLIVIAVALLFATFSNVTFYHNPESYGYTKIVEEVSGNEISY